MEEEHKDNTSPPRTRYKVYKYLTVALLFIVVFFSIGLIGVETTSSSSFCSSCHEMKPEYYTWKASTHSEVDCVKCHIGSGTEEYAKAKANGLLQVYRKATQTYTAPIRMPKEIPDSACESCHDVSKRDVTASGDIIIPHDKHKNKDIECIQCHSGVAHGKIADRKMTFQTDYQKWDSKTGKTAMADLKFIRPDMDTCIECHKARKVTNECSACHKTGMIPKSHKEADFKTKTHGKQAAEDLKKCNQCHNEMSKVPLEGYGDVSVVASFLNKDNALAKQKNHYNYAKENTFCQDCHNKRPTSHDSNFYKNHGTIANKSQETCKACHDTKKTNTPGGNQVVCSSCHPSSHSQKQGWKERHPISLDGVKGPSAKCYTCHSKPSCEKCHKE
ncbi:cytochrome c3 family protein [Neobacillus drentensis]|jgi:nitrate/TMAO reductase-like tetraheme cytochrome c subunit|uniref:cytochrome c3 family protein n=1 Tax=Neobacillus drentensis TaxID=220684 RepID=UPI002FFFF3F8